MPRSRPAARHPIARCRLRLAVVATCLLPATVRAVVPECEAAAKALAEERYRHWESDLVAQRALLTVSDSIALELTASGDVSFFDVRATGRLIRQRCDSVTPDANGRSSCEATERRPVPVSDQSLLDAAVIVRRHNAGGASSSALAAAVRRACGTNSVSAALPLNRGVMFMEGPERTKAGGLDAFTDEFCKHGAPFVGGWTNWTSDGGRTWSLRPSIGWCKG